MIIIHSFVPTSLMVTKNWSDTIILLHRGSDILHFAKFNAKSTYSLIGRSTSKTNAIEAPLKSVFTRNIFQKYCVMLWAVHKIPGRWLTKETICSAVYSGRKTEPPTSVERSGIRQFCQHPSILSADFQSTPEVSTVNPKLISVSKSFPKLNYTIAS